MYVVCWVRASTSHFAHAPGATESVCATVAAGSSKHHSKRHLLIRKPNLLHLLARKLGARLLGLCFRRQLENDFPFSLAVFRPLEPVVNQRQRYVRFSELWRLLDQTLKKRSCLVEMAFVDRDQSQLITNAGISWPGLLRAPEVLARLLVI